MKNIPPHHRLHKTINRNTVKISYSCMPKMASHISSNNKNIQESKKSQHPNPKTWDFQVPENCKTIICCYLSSRCNSKNR